MNRVSLTMPAPVASSHRARVAGMTLTLLSAVGGLALAILLPAMWPLAVSASCALACVWLMHTQPLGRHVEYFSVDEDGLRYVHPDGRVSQYQWTEILAVTGAKGGLRVETGRGAQKGATVFFAMPSADDCRAASQAAAHWLAAYRL
nr:hypothetical protein [uncultured Duganella sp.]